MSACAGCDKAPCRCVTVRAIDSGELLRVDLPIRSIEAERSYRHYQSRQDGLLSTAEFARVAGVPLNQVEKSPQDHGGTKNGRGHWRFPDPRAHREAS